MRNAESRAREQQYDDNNPRETLVDVALQAPRTITLHGAVAISMDPLNTKHSPSNPRWREAFRS
jgi:hypothetical protein